MRTSVLVVLLASLLFTVPVEAQPPSLTYGEDYTYTEEIHDVTTVQVAPNRVDHYLAGIQRSWAPANDVAMEMGLLHDYRIYVSELPNGGDFNILLITVYENAEQRARNQDPEMFAEFNRRVEVMMSDQETFEITEFYTGIREIVGQYLMRAVEFN